MEINVRNPIDFIIELGILPEYREIVLRVARTVGQEPLVRLRAVYVLLGTNDPKVYEKLRALQDEHFSFFSAGGSQRGLDFGEEVHRLFQTYHHDKN